jgi:solute:Na+ symporter, SSS family
MLDAVDYAVLAGYVVVVLAIGVWSGRGQHTTKDYFLGGRSMPWWAAGLSIIATETSALTFVGTPVQALRGDWTYLQLAFGSVLARFLVARLLIETYYRAEVYTVYGYLGQRFGALSRNVASALFFIGRSLGSGVRLYAGAIALVIVAGMSFPMAIASISLLAVVYTIFGGIRSVIWTDVVQGALIGISGSVALYYLVGLSGESLGEMFGRVGEATTATGHSKMRVIDLSLDPRMAYTLAAGLVGSTFLTLSTHGTDQDMIQRSLTCREAKGGRYSLVFSALLNIPIAALFLAVGSALWATFGSDQAALAYASDIAARHGLAPPEKGFEFIFPVYIIEALPSGVRGLILAGLFSVSMSSLDSAIAALASTAVKEVWEPYVAPGRSEAHYLRVSRWMSVFFGVALCGIAVYVWLGEDTGSASTGFGVLALGLKVLSWIFPPMLGMFLVGVLTSRGNDMGNVIALGAGIGVLLAVEFSRELFGSAPPFAWSWNALVGCAITFSLAVLFPARPEQRLAPG